MHHSSGVTLREAVTRAALFYRKSSRMFLVAVLLASLVVIPNGSFIISGGGNNSQLAGQQQQQLPSPNPTFQLIVALPPYGKGGICFQDSEPDYSFWIQTPYC